MMNPIAIIGIACLFPGADTPQAFWNLLKRGERATSDATPDKIGGPLSAWYDPTRTAPDTSYFLHGGYITDFAPSADGYALPASTINRLSHAARWALHTGRGALADSGYLHAEALKRAGVVLGNLSMPTPEANAHLTPVYDALFAKALRLGQRHRPPHAHRRDALSPGYPAALMSTALNLGLGGFALDAACSSSLYAVGLACDYLNSHRADLMLAGAVSAADPLFVNMGFAHLGGFPADGADSLPLDRRSDGLIAGEGAGMFVLKRHADALRDGDKIYGVVRGVGLANDGAGKHVLTPNSKGQVLALRRAYAQADIAPTHVHYVECHASGTSVGDKTELTSMAHFFGEFSNGGPANGAHPPPKIGSVKSNVGHLMTAAGMASMVKLVLSLTHAEIPPTIRVEQPLMNRSEVVTKTQAWHAEPGNPRIAGANAFGFGGVSAHLILSDNVNESETVTTPTRTSPVRMAITGMGAHFGKFDTLDRFARALFDGETAFRPLPANRWKGLHQHPEVLSQFGLNSVPQGAYIDSFELDFAAMKIPPNPADEPIPQQLLLLKVADAAIRDAGLTPGGNVAVIVALGTELALHQYRARADLNWKLHEMLDGTLPPEQEAALRDLLKDSLLTPAQVNHYTSYIGNIAASRVASVWDFNGPAYTVTAEENSVFKALEVAQMMLEQNQVDAVVIGAVDLAGSLESVITRNSRAPLHSGAPVAGFDSASTGWQVGEGAGAIVLTRADRAGTNSYAVIDALTFAHQPSNGTDGLPAAPTPQAITQAAESALQAANIRPEQVGYVELHGCGIAHQDDAELHGITAAYRGAPAQTAIGTVQANIGHTYIASGMAALMKSALAVSHRFIPAIPNWNAPKAAERWDGTPFWVATKSRTWFAAHRIAAVSGASTDGTAAHVILSNAPASTRQPDYLRGGLPALIVISAQNPAEFSTKLSALQARITEDDALPTLADATFADYDTNAAYAVALVAKSAEALRQEIDRALTGIPQAVTHSTDWATPAGSAFSARPAGKAGHVAFVYPGAFNSYPKMGYELFHLFPHTLSALQDVKSDLGEAVAERLLYPRSLSKPDAKLTRAMKDALARDAIATIESGLSFALVYSRAMQDVFGLKPDSAFGYSLGEGSMMWGMGVWRDGDAGSEAFHQSRLFTDRLVDPMLTVREAWGIDAHTPTSDFWAAYFIAAPAEQVKAAVERESRVYLTHINTPHEVMIAGDPAACERVLAQVNGEKMKAPFSVVIHADVMMGEYGEFYRLHDLPVTPVPGVDFYSAADYAPIKHERAVVASAISRMVCKPVDFAKLVRTAYEAGARAFIELGPRSTCARWVSDTLGDAPHVAVSVDNISADARTSVIRLLAGLVAHRVPVRLDALFNTDPSPTAVDGKSLVRRVRLGGADIYAAIQAGLPAILSADAMPQPATPTVPPTVPPLTQTASGEDILMTDIHSVHTDFLRARKEGLRGLRDLIAAQMTSPADAPTVPTPTLPPPPAPNPITAPSIRQGLTPLYPFEAIDTFALRRIADTFGDRYAIYDGRRAPRIPNGDLLLISRIVNIEGERYKPGNGTNVLAEYDVPVDAWYYTDSPYPTMPYSVLMEIALQPCGILSAYHGPTFAYPDADLYFRNLDGDGRLIKDRDMRGRTITNHVKMLSHASIGGSILQKYSFDLYDDGELFYTGTAVFGYFTQESLASRAGLDAGTSRDRWIDTENPAGVITLSQPQSIGGDYLRLGNGQLDLVHQIKVVLDGGQYGKGYAYARTDIDPSMWFFKNHFHEDPVMPGSIGVETMMEALQGFAIQSGLTAARPGGHFAHADSRATPDGHKVWWRYRGQVLGTFKNTHVEVNVKDIRHLDDGEIVIIADGSLWRENLRIYEVNDLALSIRP